MSAVKDRLFSPDLESQKTSFSFEALSEKLYKNRWRIVVVALAVLAVIGTALLLAGMQSNALAETVNTFDPITHQSLSTVTHLTTAGNMVTAGSILVVGSTAGLAGLTLGAYLAKRNDAERPIPTTPWDKISEELYKRRWEIAAVCLLAIIVVGAILAIQGELAKASTQDIGTARFDADMNISIKDVVLTPAGKRLILGAVLAAIGTSNLVGLGISKWLSNRKVIFNSSYSIKKDHKPPLNVENQVQNDQL